MSLEGGPSPQVLRDLLFALARSTNRYQTVDLALTAVVLDVRPLRVVVSAIEEYVECWGDVVVYGRGRAAQTQPVDTILPRRRVPSSCDPAAKGYGLEVGV